MKNSNFIGWLGMALIQFNSIPAIIEAIKTGSSTPFLSVILTVSGLILLTVYSIILKDRVYIFGNLSGLVGNLILLWCIFRF